MSNLGRIAIARDRFYGNEVYHRKMLTDMTQIEFFALRVIKCNFLPADINIGQTFVYWYSLLWGHRRDAFKFEVIPIFVMESLSNTIFSHLTAPKILLFNLRDDVFLIKHSNGSADR